MGKIIYKLYSIIIDIISGTNNIRQLICVHVIMGLFLINNVNEYFTYYCKSQWIIISGKV